MLGKFNHIVAMKGIILQKTSSLDEKSLEIVNDYFDKKSDNSISDALFGEIISFHKRKFKDIEKFKKIHG
jgi:hypothetical protein